MAENTKNLQDQLDLVTSRLDAMLEQRGLAGKPAPKPARALPNGVRRIGAWLVTVEPF